MATIPKDTWSAGDRYEPYVGRWSRRVAVQLLHWLGVPAGGAWLDVGCGTGALSAVILERAQPREVVGVDPSPYFVSYAQQRLNDPRASFRVGDAQALPLAAASFDAAAAALVLNFVPNPALAVAEMARTVKPGGTVAAYVWDYAGRMDLMRRFWAAAADTDPAAAELDEARRFPIVPARCPGRAVRGRRPAGAWRRPRSTSKRRSATSTTTGSPSSADRARRPATPCRSARPSANACASG